MPQVPQEALDQINAALAPSVVRMRHSIAEDWAGDVAIFFRIVLSDETARTMDAAFLHHVHGIIRERLEMVGCGGWNAYVNFRSLSEQEALKEPEWE